MRRLLFLFPVLLILLGAAQAEGVYYHNAYSQQETCYHATPLCIDAGGEYMITPNVSVPLIRSCVAKGLVAMPGAMTPSEAVDAWEAGASFVKIFPAGSLGTGYVKAVCAPLSHIPFLAVGGISPENVGDFVRAGCAGAGVGGNLTNKEWIASGSWGRIAEAARLLVANACRK